MQAQFDKVAYVETFCLDRAQATAVARQAMDVLVGCCEVQAMEVSQSVGGVPGILHCVRRGLFGVQESIVKHVRAFERLLVDDPDKARRFAGKRVQTLAKMEAYVRQALTDTAEPFARVEQLILTARRDLAGVQSGISHREDYLPAEQLVGQLLVAESALSDANIRLGVDTAAFLRSALCHLEEARQYAEQAQLLAERPSCAEGLNAYRLFVATNKAQIDAEKNAAIDVFQAAEAVQDVILRFVASRGVMFDKPEKFAVICDTLSAVGH